MMRSLLLAIILYQELLAGLVLADKWIEQPETEATEPIVTYVPWLKLKEGLNPLYNLNIQLQEVGPPLPVRKCRHDLSPCPSKKFWGMKTEEEEEINMCVFNEDEPGKKKRLYLRFMEHASCECQHWAKYIKKLKTDIFILPKFLNATLLGDCAEMTNEAVLYSSILPLLSSSLLVSILSFFL
ncbi:hypothetical protein Hamer_G020417 [Homarus americanus]|uniref:Uncharacterized protein n=2 Tax=Homarus americanus TaxID=6706 RepID=A0A8J5JWR8_HOMAM|nr:hypothetical protein Hamer_G020417 [Homarus americanus]